MTPIKVTDHARLRYCERVLGADINEIDTAILGEIGNTAAALGDGIYPVFAGSCRAIVQGGQVVTIVPSKKRKFKPKKRQRLDAYESILALADEEQS